MILARLILARVIGAYAVLHDYCEGFTVGGDALYETKMECHAVVVVATVLVCSHQAIVRSQRVTLALEGVFTLLQRDPCSFPSPERRQFVFGERSSPEHGLMCPAKRSRELQIHRLRINLDMRVLRLADILNLEIKFEPRGVHLDESATWTLINSDQILLVFNFS